MSHCSRSRRSRRPLILQDNNAIQYLHPYSIKTFVIFLGRMSELFTLIGVSLFTPKYPPIGYKMAADFVSNQI